MLIKSLITCGFVLTLAVVAFAQNANTNATRSRQATTNANTSRTTAPPAPAQTPTGAVREEEATPPPAATTTGARRRTATATRQPSRAPVSSAAAREVRDAFDALIDGISRADVAAVMSAYQNSPQLLVFNYNGTTTRGWAQVRANRESSYPNIQDAKVAVRDVRVELLGPDAALVTCLWTQTQTYKGTPESSSGRLTLVFRRAGAAWKVVHTHTSPDAPDPSRLPPSEQTDAPANTTTPARPTPKP